MAGGVINLSDGESDIEILDSRSLERPILIPSSDDEQEQNVDNINSHNSNLQQQQQQQQRRDTNLSRLRRHPDHFSNEDSSTNIPQNVEDDSVEFIGEQQIPGGNEFTANASPRSNFFHLHLPNGRMLLSRMMFDDGSPPPGPILRRNRIFPHRMNTITSAQQRQATLRQNRLRRLQEEANQRARIAAATNNNTLNNTLFTLSDDNDEDDADYVQDELINDDLQLISSTDSDTPPPLINLREHEIDYNRREGISPIFMLRQMFGDFTNNFNNNNNDIEHGIDDEIPGNIMEEIRRREEQMEDKRFKKRMASMDKQRRLLEKKNAIPASERDKYSNVLGSKQEPTGCELCGVELFSGIPAFEVSDNFDETFNLLVEAKFRSPWCSNLIDLSEVDKELSRKAYFCKCGHIYCGRCVKNIKMQLGRSAGEKRSLVQNEKKLLKSTDPQDKMKILKLQAKFTKNYSPTRCVGFNCSTNFTNKKSPFTQLFF